MKTLRAVAEWLGLVLAITVALAAGAVVLSAIDPLHPVQPFNTRGAV